MQSPHKVVAVHDRADSGLLDSLSECREIYLMESPLVHVGTYAVAGRLQLVVGHEMLHHGHDALILDSEDVLLGCLGSEIRVLSEVFIVPSEHRGTVDVDSRTEEDVHTTGLGVLPETVSKPQSQVLVPCGCGQCPARIERALGIVSDADRAVCNPYCRYSEPLDRAEIERPFGRDVTDFLFKCHLRHEFGSPQAVLPCDDNFCHIFGDVSPCFL